MDNKLYPEAYGQWAGNPNGQAPDYSRCCHEVGRAMGRWTSFGQCSNKRGFGPDQAYCKIHDPEAIRKRQEKSDLAYKTKYNKERYRFHGYVFFDALRKIADGHNDARGLAQEVIAEFKRGER